MGLPEFYKRDADVLLLDDPLSAVDTKVAKTIFFSAIQKLGVQRGKCVILVTHQHQFVGMADQCILMNQGQVAFMGMFEACHALMNNPSNSAIQMLEAHHEEGEEPIESTSKVMSTKESHEERRVTGIVKLHTWISYAKAFGGYAVCAYFFLILVVTQGALLATLVLLGKWGEVPHKDQKSTTWLGIVGGITAALVVLTIFRAQSSFFILIRGSHKLHNKMTRAVLRAKISFFDTNPLGRILNRFSADVGIVDELLPCKCQTLRTMSTKRRILTD